MTPEELEDWFRGRPKETRQHEAVWIAHRCAMRVLPVWWRTTQKSDLTATPVLRANLISGVAALVQTPEISRAAALADSAAALADSAAALAAEAAGAVRGAEAPLVSLATLVVEHAAVRAAGASRAALAAEADRAALAAALARDVSWLKDGNPPGDLALWPDPVPDLGWSDWQRDSAGRPNGPWAFWTDWYRRAHDGLPQPMDLLEKIALQPEVEDGEDWDPDTFWDGPDAEVNTRIAEIVAEWEAGQDDAELDAASEVRRLPPATQEQVQRTKSAMETYRDDLPPTLDAVLGFVELEIQRLQGKNYFPDEEAREENRRQIKVLTTLHQAVSRLKELVPATPDMPKEDAEEAEKLGRLYFRLVRDWPRANAEELVDNAYRGAFIGATTLALPMIGVAPTAALAGGMIIFGGKKMIDAAKAAKDLWK